MKVKEFLVPEQTIQGFAEDHGLTMEIHERGADTIQNMQVRRYYAKFSGGEILDGSMLCSATGNGDTKSDAVSDYASRISEKRLVFNATNSRREEINVPRLVE